MQLGIAPGPPSWGGGRQIIRDEVWPIVDAAGISPTSGKRRESFGNLASDHFWLNLKAFAKDYATTNNFALAQKIRSKLDPGGVHHDYESFIIERRVKPRFLKRFRRAKLHRYRVQIIAGTHGTGPHLHIGIKRES